MMGPPPHQYVPMHQTSRDGRHPEPPNPLADEAADEAGFCRTCAFARACLAVGGGKTELSALHCLVESVGPLPPGGYLFREGDPFRAIFAVRTGAAKTSTIDHAGRQQVLGFHLPGEVIGLDAIHPDRFPCNAIALEPAQFCRFSFPAISALATRMPVVQQHLFRMLSKEIGTVGLLVGDYSADERMAAFLIDLSERYAVRGFSSSRFRLSMSRADIANYLRLASETVSRVLGRFRSTGLVEIEGRELFLCDPPRLRDIGKSLLQG